MLSTNFVQGYLDPVGFCSIPDPFLQIKQVADLETRLHMLTLAAALNAFSAPNKIATMAAHPDDWLLNSSEVAYKRSQEVGAALVQLRLGGAKQDGRVWWQICRGIQGRFKGSITALLDANGYDTNKLQAYLQESKTTFPVLSGPVISVRWLDLVSRWGDKPLAGWEELQIPFTEGLREQGSFLDQSQTMIHPAAAAAIEHWAQSCRSGKEGGCGWAECPNRAGGSEI
jgi:hypothetical protein